MNWIAFVSGVSLKLYDDFVVDNAILTDPVWSARLHAFVIASFTLTLASDLWVCVGLYTIFACVSFLEPNAWATPYEQSCLGLLPLLLYAAWTTRTHFEAWDSVLLSLLGVGTLEPIVFPEDVSPAKWVARFSVAVLGVPILLHVPMGVATKTILTWCYGYYLTSSFFQTLKLTLSQQPVLGAFRKG